MEYKVNKAKIKNLTLEVEMEETVIKQNNDRIINDITKKSDQLIHPDLQAAFDKLIPHLVLICDQKEDGSALRILLSASDLFEPDNYDKEQLMKYRVTGFVIGGDDRSGVTLVGQKELEGGKVINLISPFSKYEDYKHGNELAEVIEGCVYEVEQYLFQGKCAEDNQMKIPFDESFETESYPAEPMPEKKKKGKKTPIEEFNDSMQEAGIKVTASIEGPTTY